MKIIIVTGLSGAGKTHAMDCLEDMGYYAIDNMPPALIKNFIDMAMSGKGIDKAAFGIDVRGGILFDDFRAALEGLKQDGIDYKILYLEATDRALARRYNETRRDHPLAEGQTVGKGIRRERKKLEEIRKEADYIIDTSNLKTSQLAAEIENIVSAGEDERVFVVRVMSFGYKNGMPVSADMVFDARFIPNPYYVKSLKELTGNDSKVSSYVLKHDVAQQFMASVTRMIDALIPYYRKEGKYSLNVCFGCTGGHHRSVALANELQKRLTELGIRTTVSHRDL
ncbi:MAG: RNase adapter RapZ [Clostridiales bacterium]|nr:RNase adapter RapZ [Clostridiales bacterium]MDD7035400.1 RNase adapter RapZ [Bacillota bacterium]MDY2920796.1 RNase adapter RapZ [Lentihominibacter sp.]